MVVAPKVSSRLDAVFPNLRQASIRAMHAAVRGIGLLLGTVAFAFVGLGMPLTLRAVVTLGFGTLFVAGLLSAVGREGAPGSRTERAQRIGGLPARCRRMAMTFGGSFGVAFLFEGDETGLRGP